MGRLIQAEFLKLSKSLGYKILLLCALGLGVLIGCLVTFMDIGIEMNGHLMLLQCLSETQSQGIFASIFAAVFICGEFSDRTFGISIMSGCPRLHILLSKAAVYTVGLLSIIFVYPMAGTAVATVRLGFGTMSPELWRHLGLTLFLFIVGIIAMGGFCFMLAMLIKSVGGTIGAGIGLLLVLILAGQFPPFAPVMKFTFTYQLAQVSQPQSLALYHAVISATIVLTLVAARILFDKAELK